MFVILHFGLHVTFRAHHFSQIQSEQHSTVFESKTVYAVPS